MIRPDLAFVKRVLDTAPITPVDPTADDPVDTLEVFSVSGRRTYYTIIFGGYGAVQADVTARPPRIVAVSALPGHGYQLRRSWLLDAVARAGIGVELDETTRTPEEQLS